MTENNPYLTTSNLDEAQAGPKPTSAYCQECGRALTSGTLRRLAGGIYCLPCAAQRSSRSGWQAVTPSMLPGDPAQGVPGGVPQSGPKPAVACMLGFIPGVGAMYNGQYAKAAMHLVVFVGLLTLADHLTSALYWLVFGWVFYQVFDAYHTARARRDGLPLPDPFGWNEVGERWGGTQVASEVTASWADRTTQRRDPGMPVAAARGSASTQPGNVQPSPGFAGSAASATDASPVGSPTMASQADRPSFLPFLHPAAAAGRAYGSPQETGPVQPNGVAWQSSPATPFSPTYMGVPGVNDPMGTPVRRFPVGAVWLIGLGLLFLLGNVLPRFAINGQWLVPFLLLAVSLWSGSRRMAQQRRSAAARGKEVNVACALTGPAVLTTLAVLMMLQAAHAFSLARTWPLLLVVWGSMLLLQRAFHRSTDLFAEAGFGPLPAVPDPLTRAHAAPPPPVRSASGTGSLGL